MTITAAARAAGLSRTTLMYYERLGLIRPQRRADSRYRSFNARTGYFMGYDGQPHFCQ